MHVASARQSVISFAEYGTAFIGTYRTWYSNLLISESLGNSLDRAD